MRKEKVKKPFYKKWWVWLLGIIIIGSLASNGGEETADTSKEELTSTEEVQAEPEEEVQAEPEEEVQAEPEEEVQAEPEEEVQAEPEEEVQAEPEEEVQAEPEEEVQAEPEVTLEQENAIQKAKDYLNFTAFSKSGLVTQLEYDGFSNEDSTFAVNNIEVDWKEYNTNTVTAWERGHDTTSP